MKWFKRLFGLSLFFALASCAKDDTPSGDLNGAYYGNYKQSGTADDSSGTVRLVFVGSIFSGESQGTVRPICNGSYVVTGDSINFMNLCSVPDSTLLLAGKYKITAVGDSLYFTRTSNGNIYFQELFSLKKQ